MSDWARTHAKRDDPDTSHEAARKAEGLAASHCEIIFRAMSETTAPLSASQIADATGMERHAIGRRLPDLEKAGRIHKTEHRHVNRNGRKEVQYAISFRLEG